MKLLPLLSLAFLSGCTLIPHYERPNLPVPKQLAAISENKQTAKPARKIHWKTFFISPDLQNVIQTALENNRDLRSSMLQIEAARTLYRIERSALVPNINAGATMNRQNIPEALIGSNPLASGQGNRIVTQYQANLFSTAFELDMFGRIRSLSEAALQAYLATEAAANTAKVTLIAETANAYLQWLADRKILQLSQETLKTQQKSQELINASYEKGIASKLDVSRIETAVESARVNTALYTRLVEQDRNALFLLMGRHDTTLLPEKTELHKIEILETLPSDLSSSILLQRPDIQQAEHRLKAANANIGAARAAFFPVISLTGSYGYASGELSDLFSNSAKGAWSFAPQLTLPIFNGGFNFATLGFSKANKEIAVAEYQAAIQSAFREVADGLATRKTLGDQLSAQRKLVRATQESYDLSYARYQAGLDSFLNVLDAQRSLFAAQQQAIDVERARLANLVNLYKSLGGGPSSSAKTDT